MDVDSDDEGDVPVLPQEAGPWYDDGVAPAPGVSVTQILVRRMMDFMKNHPGQKPSLIDVGVREHPLTASAIKHWNENVYAFPGYGYAQFLAHMLRRR